MTIRRARPDDLAVLRNVQQELTDPAPQLLDQALGTDGPVFVVVATTKSKASGDHSALVGYVIVVPGPEAVYLPELAVDGAHQRSGYGSALLEWVAAHARRSDQQALWVTVAATDDDALAFYRAEGFERTDHLPDWFETDDGVVLSRPIG